ncbi:DUF6390 family protein [Nocardioides sp.]|uniref:DUF6390 family protein n=1 Tax=Nocardioides sp. TaxID=35761 RepID=UPI0027372230|nr:DUF6390 family protein [Nocardioides sp.]MDP3893348.1 DUF6390 family protein [Nocardioides sp.]
MDAPASGALRFARYAYPPNELGYCGPDASAQLLEQVAAGEADEDLRRLLRGFEGAWPYLELIAAANGIGDPLDERVVEAYWIGNALLERVGPRLMGDSLEDRFRRRAGRSWTDLAAPVPDGAVPHHSFHVFGVYPWLGLLREGRLDEPLRVLDRCRIRWGQVISVSGGEALVRSRPLVWDGRRVELGEPAEERVLAALDDRGLARGIRPGSWCSLHWDWICEELDSRSLARLRHVSLRQLAVINGARIPGPATVLS